jgi:cysteine desulfurase
MMARVYLDHAATTPLSAVAEAAARRWMDAGNASSLYEEGRRAKAAIDAARETVSRALGCLFAEVVFTASGTEAANLAMIGAALANEDHRRDRILFGASEHHCVLHTLPVLDRLGYRVDLLPVDRYGRIRLDALEDALDERTLLVSAMHANNELGTFNDVGAIREATSRCGALLHCDAVQTFLSGHEGAMSADLASVSAHKVNGPKGAGALYVRVGTRVKPLAVGGGQERELRAGTENVAAIAGFGAAVEARLYGVPDNRLSARAAFLAALDRNMFVETVPEDVPTLSGHLHLRCPRVSAETLLILLDRMGVSASSGAACSSGSIEPSHVLLACGYSPQEAKEGLRFTFGHSTSDVEAAEAAGRVNRAARQILG